MWRSKLSPIAPIALVALVALVATIALPGCEAAPRNHQAIRAYYDHDYAGSRDALRGDAYGRNDKNDEQVLLDNLRLGMAALADGDTREAERALDTSWDLLSTAGLNADRTTAAILVHEGVRIWKGEPFEQALAYHYVATLYAVLGDWENARAAAANGLFRLTDFGADQTKERIARRAARSPGYLKQGYTAVDTDFALGFLMQATASEIAGAAGAREQFDAALKIEPRLAPLVSALRARQFDTLLIVDYGKGPTKVAYGPDGSLARFEPQERTLAPLAVRLDGRRAARASPVCDVNRMARDHRWNNLEDVRRAKSAFGDALVFGGAVVAMSGSPHEGPGEALVRVLIGAGMWGAGLLTKSGARADTRYLEFAPQAIYLVPLRLKRPREITLTIEHGAAATVVLPDVVPGTDREPRAIYVRMHAGSSADPEWLTAGAPIYGNDHTGVRPGDFPWILGGTDVSTPSRAALQAYQANGYLLGLTVRDLHELYRAEGITIGSGAEQRAGPSRSPSYRHVLEGGTGLFTPLPDSLGYKRLMFTRRPPYVPRSDLVRGVARRNGTRLARSSTIPTAVSTAKEYRR